MPKPTLVLTKDHRANLTEYFEDTIKSLATYLALEDVTPAHADAMAKATEVSSLLEGVVHSSDTDCEYFPCLLLHAEPTDASFFKALGIKRGAVASVSGWENPKLEVVAAGKGKGKRDALALITRLNDDEFNSIDEYVEDGEQKRLRAAIAKLEAVGPIVGIQLCTDDGASKVVLTLARQSEGTHLGLLTIRVET